MFSNVDYNICMLKKIIISICILVSPAFADGVYSKSASVPTPRNQLPPSLDKRLPPVVPGERAVINGKDMRLWSTSGPVTVSEAPEPFKDSRQTEEFLRRQGGGIIVDDRRLQPLSATDSTGTKGASQGASTIEKNISAVEISPE